MAIMYNPQKNIDRSLQSRTVPMEFLSLGYSRTGTLSIRLALEILGYPNPYHFSSFWDNVVECDMWTSALQAKYYGKGPLPDEKFFDGLLGHVGAVTDSPCNLFAAELVTFYPDAKVVLVEREIESWFASWYAFCVNSYNPVFQWLAMLDPGFCARIVSVGTLGVHPHTGFATNLDEVRVRSSDAYRHHYRDVRDMVPKENLLNFQLKEGSEPLCKFLDKPIPVSRILIVKGIPGLCLEPFPAYRPEGMLLTDTDISLRASLSRTSTTKKPTPRLSKNSASSLSSASCDALWSSPPRSASLLLLRIGTDSLNELLGNGDTATTQPMLSSSCRAAKC